MSNIQPKNNLLLNAVLYIKFFSEVGVKKKKTTCFSPFKKPRKCSSSKNFLTFRVFSSKGFLFIYLFIYSLFKVDKFTIKTDIIVYTNKNSFVLIIKIKTC